LLLLLFSHTLSQLFFAGISQQWARRIADETFTLGWIIGVDVEEGFYADGVCGSVNFASHGVWYFTATREL
jgi:hypothetical protein